MGKDKFNYALGQQIKGKSLPEYMSDLIEENEAQQIDIECAKVSIGILKQMNNYSRLCIDAVKTDMKRKEVDNISRMCDTIKSDDGLKS